MSGRLPEEDYSDWHAVDQDKPLSTCACVHCELGRAKQEIERLKAIVDCCSDLVPPNDSLEVNERVAVEVERLKAERDQHREGEAALVVERDALWRRADELGREVEQLKWRRTSGPKADAEKGGGADGA